MNTSLRLLAILVLAVSGCGGSDPTRTRLASGTVAVVTAPGNARCGLALAEATDGSMVEPQNGDRVRVEEDNERPDITKGLVAGASLEETVEPDREFDLRAVRVTVLDGEHKGRTGMMQRCFLRPAQAGR